MLLSQVKQINPLLNPKPVELGIGSYAGTEGSQANTNLSNISNVLPFALPMATMGLISQAPNIINKEISAQDVIDNHLNRDYKTYEGGYNINEASIYTPQGVIHQPDPVDPETLEEWKRRNILSTPTYEPNIDDYSTGGDQPEINIPNSTGSPPVELDLPTHTGDTTYKPPKTFDDYVLYNKGLLDNEVIEDGLLSETAPPFYSKITKTIEDAKMNKASGDGWMGMINNSGVNQDELDWIGMKDFLADKKSVTKEEILDFARMNDLSTEVKEVILGQKADKLIFKGDTMEMIEGQGTTLTHDPRVPEILRNANGFEDAKLVIMNDEGLYNQLENYYPEYIQEKNIQYPVPFDEFSNNDENIVVKNFLKDKFNIEVDQNDSQGRTIHGSNKNLITEGDYTDYKEMTFALPNIDADFTGGHYKDKNIFAHARFNTREIDGKKTLFIEELQSDWVHKGKNFGYSDLTLNVDEINNELIRLSRQKEELIDTDYSTMSEHNAAQELIKEIKEKYEQLINKREAFVTSKKVPNLPFKNNWQDIVIKRMIRYASENGFDAIAMTGGNIQKDRYDLSKQIDTLSYNETTGSINGYKDGQAVLFQQNVTKDNLADYVGKEVAKKIQEAGYEKITMEGAENVKMKRLSGLDLQVGGEGLGNMYDTIFKSSLKKVGKKYGAEVELKNLDDFQGHNFKIQPMLLILLWEMSFYKNNFYLI